ncbi:phage tail domain-containing protein [Virgibacillus salexigens]|uniref:phage tail domain-containing protein n=1 Tax=Virgibacillus salexigens TaxID=61016 RepID=UPI00190A29C9|nr:phage tail domain-containing protein [Virgibacillus salexigens]
MFARFYDENMYPLPLRDIVSTNINIPSIPFANNWQGGSEGILPIRTGVDVEQRPIEVTFESKAFDYLDYQLLRDELYSILGFDKPMYLVDIRQPGKRYKVVLESSFTPTRNNATNGTYTVPFTTEETPYAESIGTTQDIQLNGIDADSELWGFGMGLIANDESLIYTHETNEFRIFNAGNRPIHPFQQELKITISDIGIEPSRNMFDGTYYDWFIYDYSDTAYLRRNYQGEEYTLMIPVDSGQTYTIKVHDKENSNQFTIATAPTEPVFDGAGIFDMGRPVHLQGKFSHQERTYTLTIPEGDNYLYVMAAQDQEPPSKIQVEQGDTATPYKPHPSEDQFIELRNKTNNTRFKSTDTFANEDVIIIHGPNVTKNSQAYLRKTTKEFIELLPGWNEFEVIGVSNAKIEFDFRFYYA